MGVLKLEMKKILLRKIKNLGVLAYILFAAVFAVAVIEVHAEDDAENIVWVDENVELVQDGKMVCQYFQPDQEILFFSADNWEIILSQRIKDAFDNCETTISVADLQLDKDSDYARFRDIYRSTITGNYFYITGSYSWSYSQSTNYINSIKIKYQNSHCDENGSPDKRKIAKDVDLFQYQTEKAMHCIDYAKDDIEIALLLHDFLIRECDYDEENYLNNSIPEKSYNAYGALVDGQAVCNGYAIAYSYLLQQSGIESYVLASDVMNHAWNLIRLDGSWYHVDVTWDDPVFTSGKTFFSQYNADYADEGFMYHKYFLCSDDEFTDLDHKGWKLQTGSSDLPAADRSGNFENYLFKDRSIAAYFRINEKLYYYDLSEQKLAETADLTGTGLTEIDLDTDQLLYGHGCDHAFYFNTMHEVYAFEPDSGTYQIIYQTEDDSSIVSELSIKNGYLVYIVTDSENNSTRMKQYISTIPEYKQPESAALSRIIPYAGKLKIVWEPLEKIDGYVIYQSMDPEGKYSVVKNIPDYQLSSYNHKITDHEMHYYKIRSYRIYENKKVYSEYSEILSAKVLPDSPSDFSVEAVSYNKLQISWAPVEGADGYVLYEKKPGENSFSLLKAFDAQTEFYTRKVSESKDYIYKIRAYYINEGKKVYGLYSREAVGRVISGPPGILSVKRITASKNKITWDMVPDADGYIIYQSVDGKNYSILKVISDEKITSYNHTISSNDENYYKMRAFQIINGEKVYSQYTSVFSDRE